MSLLCFLVNQEAIQATFWGHDTPRPFTEVGVFRLLAALYSRLKRAGAEERTPIIERVDGETIQDAGVAVPAEIQTLCGVQSRLHASLAAKPAWTLFRKFLRAMAYEPRKYHANAIVHARSQSCSLSCATATRSAFNSSRTSGGPCTGSPRRAASLAWYTLSFW